VFSDPRGKIGKAAKLPRNQFTLAGFDVCERPEAVVDLQFKDVFIGKTSHISCRTVQPENASHRQRSQMTSRQAPDSFLLTKIVLREIESERAL